MKVFTCTNVPGIWMSASAIVVAECKRKARVAIKRKLKAVGHWEKRGKNLVLEELDLTKPQVIIIINAGDYL